MAPSAIEPQKPSVEVIITKNASQYKEQSAGPQTYNKKLEEEGSADVPKAKVRMPRYPSTIYPSKSYAS